MCQYGCHLSPDRSFQIVFFVNNRQVANNTNLSSPLSSPLVRKYACFSIPSKKSYSVGQLFKSTQLPLIYKNSKQNSCSAVEYFGEGHRDPADRGFYHKTAGLDILCFIVLINEIVDFQGFKLPIEKQASFF